MVQEHVHLTINSLKPDVISGQTYHLPYPFICSAFISTSDVICTGTLYLYTIEKVHKLMS